MRSHGWRRRSARMVVGVPATATPRRRVSTATIAAGRSAINGRCSSCTRLSRCAVLRRSKMPAAARAAARREHRRLVDYYKPSLRSAVPADAVGVPARSLPARRSPRRRRADLLVRLPADASARLRQRAAERVVVVARTDTPVTSTSATSRGSRRWCRWAKRQGIWVTIDLHQDAWSKYVYTKVSTNCPPGTDRTRGLRRGTAVGVDLPASGMHRRRHARARSRRATRRAEVLVGRRRLGRRGAAGALRACGRRPGGAVRARSGGRGIRPHERTRARNPAGGRERPEILQFYAKVAKTIRAAVPRFQQLLFLEPGVERNTTAQRAFATSWRAVSCYRNAVYAPHVYTAVFTAGAVARHPGRRDVPVRLRRGGRRCQSARPSVWVGEFGGPPAKDKAVLAKHYAQQEARRVGGTMWLWKEKPTTRSRTPSGASTGRRSTVPTGTVGLSTNAFVEPRGSTRSSPRARCCEPLVIRSEGQRSWSRRRIASAAMTVGTRRWSTYRQSSRDGSWSRTHEPMWSIGPVHVRSGFTRTAGNTRAGQASAVMMRSWKTPKNNATPPLQGHAPHTGD